MEQIARNAGPEDIVVGQRFIMWGDEGLYRGEIAEVLRPDDQWKAFVATDGCRYGLEGLFIEIADERAAPGQPETESMWARGLY